LVFYAVVDVPGVVHFVPGAVSVPYGLLDVVVPKRKWFYTFRLRRTSHRYADFGGFSDDLNDAVVENVDVFVVVEV